MAVPVVTQATIPPSIVVVLPPQATAAPIVTVTPDESTRDPRVVTARAPRPHNARHYGYNDADTDDGRLKFHNFTVNHLWPRCVARCTDDDRRSRAVQPQPVTVGVSSTTFPTTSKPT